MVRNLVVVTASDVVIAVGGRYGTLSEIGLALRQGRDVVALRSLRIATDVTDPKIHLAADPAAAVAIALDMV